MRREWLTEAREAKKWDFVQAAKICECSYSLLDYLERDADWITHPRIAARIAAAYGLNKDQYNDLVAVQHRLKAKNELPYPQPAPTMENYKGYYATLY